MGTSPGTCRCGAERKAEAINDHRDVLETKEALITEVIRWPKLTQNDLVVDGDTAFSISITIMADFNGVLLYAEEEIPAREQGVPWTIFSPMRVPIFRGPENIKFHRTETERLKVNQLTSYGFTAPSCQWPF